MTDEFKTHEWRIGDTLLEEAGTTEPDRPQALDRSPQATDMGDPIFNGWLNLRLRQGAAWLAL